MRVLFAWNELAASQYNETTCHIHLPVIKFRALICAVNRDSKRATALAGWYQDLALHTPINIAHLTEALYRARVGMRLEGLYM